MVQMLLLDAFALGRNNNPLTANHSGLGSE